MNSTIGERIRSLREKAGLTQQQLSDALDVKRETINLWENGYRDLKTGYTVALAGFFHVDCDYILRGISAERIDIHKDVGLSDDAIARLQTLRDYSPDAFLIVNYLITDFETMKEITDCFTQATIRYHRSSELYKQAGKGEKNQPITDNAQVGKGLPAFPKEAFLEELEADFFMYKAREAFHKAFANLVRNAHIIYGEKQIEDQESTKEE